MHLHADDFWHYVVAGFIAPFEPESDAQNRAVMQAVAAAAFAYATAGYITVVDGVIGPWMLEYFQAQMNMHTNVELHYVVLRPRREVSLARAQARKSPRALVDEQPITDMWQQFANLKRYEAHVLDTSEEDSAATAVRVEAAIESGRFRLSLVPDSA